MWAVWHPFHFCPWPNPNACTRTLEKKTTTISLLSVCLKCYFFTTELYCNRNCIYCMFFFKKNVIFVCKSALHTALRMQRWRQWQIDLETVLTSYYYFNLSKLLKAQLLTNVWVQNAFLGNPHGGGVHMWKGNISACISFTDSWEVPDLYKVRREKMGPLS